MDMIRGFAFGIASFTASYMVLRKVFPRMVYWKVGVLAQFPGIIVATIYMLIVG